MTQQVRAGYRGHRKATWAAAVLIVLVAAALAVVLPALGSNTTGCTPNSTSCVKPASTLQSVTPSIVNVGGSNFSCGSAGTTYGGTPTPSGMVQFQISKPTPGSYTDPNTGVTFDITAPSAGLDPTAYFSFSVRGNAAVVEHVGVKGGTNVAWYDYKNNTPANPAVGSGVYSDTNLHSTPDSKYTVNKPTFFVASITTFCYIPLSVTPSCTSPFDGIGFGAGVAYSAQLMAVNGQCKNSNVVMYTYNNNGTLFATLHPVTQGGGTFKVVEHIHWRGFGSQQNPVTLRYNDQPPYNVTSSSPVMKLCVTDPRPDPINNPFTLPAGVTDSAVLPAGETSCMLQSTDSAPASGDPDTSRQYDAWIYSNTDGGRSG